MCATGSGVTNPTSPVFPASPGGSVTWTCEGLHSGAISGTCTAIRDNQPIDIAAIPGVTAPVTGATPVSTITETSQYTGAVSWSGSPTTFAGGTVYTAHNHINSQVRLHFNRGQRKLFTYVSGATSVTNAANSGVVTAVFPATANV